MTTEGHQSDDRGGDQRFPPPPPQRRVGPYEASLLANRERAERAARQSLTRRRRTLVAVGAVATAVVVAAALGARTWLGRPGSSTVAGIAPVATAQSHVHRGCPEPPMLTIAVPEALGTTFSDLVDGFQALPDAPCASFTVVPRASSAVAQSLAGPVRPDAWVTDAALWLDQANHRAGLGLLADEPFATSRVVLAVRPEPAPGAAVSWAGLAAGGIPVTIPDPATSTAGLFALAAAAGRWSSPQLAEVAARSRQLLPGESALGVFADPDTDAAAPVAEAELAAYNAANPSVHLAAVVPSDRVAPLEYAFVPVADGTVASRVLRSLADYLGSDAARAVLTRHGFSAPGAAASPAPPTPGAADALREEWAAVDPAPHAVVALDVSAASLSRLDGETILDSLAESTQLAVASLPDRSSVALWYFAQHLGPRGEDHRVVADSGPLTAPAQIQTIARGLGGMSGVVGGDRGLYDTIEAAHQAAAANASAGRPSTAVIVTTGPNDDDFGASLGAVKSAVAKADPARPVHLVIVGIGTKPDAAVLAEIAKAGRGQYIAVTKREELAAALTRALSDPT
ncbi:substrate-binding and VWA domain-containing protein [Terrabacter sp. MAHUQ-38]|uniref:substrate-binding and VWA domain-containing protein n=1 Tax=unclassified Terrabacter TaxID=2630222 RepID=UPI00165EAA3C|nr:VWA domain-containing protein [Terrabacter sp. MAHUQ-38]